MGEQQKRIKGKLEVFIGRGIKIITDIESEEEIIATLSCLEKIKEQVVKFDKVLSQGQPPAVIPGAQPQITPVPEDDSYEKIANMLNNISAAELRAKKIFSIKDQNVQLLKPNQFSKVMDAICVLLFLLEVGIGKRDIQYNMFRDIFESQNIKSGSPLTMLMINMKIAKYIDPKKYKTKIVSLTPKGQEQAIAVLTKLS